MALDALQEHKPIKAQDQLSKAIANPKIPARNKVLANQLIAILGGMRDLSLCEDPALNLYDAVELQLMLEQLKGK